MHSHLSSVNDIGLKGVKNIIASVPLYNPLIPSVLATIYMQWNLNKKSVRVWCKQIAIGAKKQMKAFIKLVVKFC